MALFFLFVFCFLHVVMCLFGCFLDVDVFCRWLRCCVVVVLLLCGRMLYDYMMEGD